MKPFRHTKVIRTGYPSPMEESVMVAGKKEAPVLALVFVDGDGRDDNARKMLSELFFKVVAVRTSEEGIWTVRRIAAGGERVGFFLFDSSIPEGEVVDFIAFARGRGNMRKVPAMVLTEGADPETRVRWLEAGADEVLSVPCPPRETLARIRALMRRDESKENNPYAPARYVAGALVVDTDRHEVVWQEKRIQVTPLEFRILVHLVRDPGKVFPREKLMSLLWGEHWEVEDHNLSVHIHGLRKKLSRPEDDRTPIETVRGVGYRIRETLS